MGSETYTEILQLCKHSQPNPVFIDGLVGNGGESLPIDRVYLGWLWLGWWRLICWGSCLLYIRGLWYRLVGLCRGYGCAIGRWGWQISSGHGQSRWAKSREACDRLIEALYSSPCLFTTMEGFDEEIESILYMCREVSGASRVRKSLTKR